FSLSAGSVPPLPVDRSHPRAATMILSARSIFSLATAAVALLAEYNFRATGRRVLLLADSTTTRVSHFILGGGVRRGHDPRRPENRSLTFFRRCSPSRLNRDRGGERERERRSASSSSVFLFLRADADEPPLVWILSLSLSFPFSDLSRSLPRPPAAARRIQEPPFRERAKSTN
ncbi:hypothetical protein X777_01220, partial [Ooceraea biroi]